MFLVIFKLLDFDDNSFKTLIFAAGFFRVFKYVTIIFEPTEFGALKHQKRCSVSLP